VLRGRRWVLQLAMATLTAVQMIQASPLTAGSRMLSDGLEAGLSTGFLMEDAQTVRNMRSRRLLQTKYDNLGARRRRTDRTAQREANNASSADSSIIIGILVSCLVLFFCFCICGYVYRSKFRVATESQTTTTADGRTVIVAGGGKAMKKIDFEAKVGKLGFDLADKDGSGQVSKREWLELFETVDINGDGEISQQEWEKAFGKGSFDVWDKDCSGAIDQGEWKKIFMSRQAAMKQAASSKGSSKKYKAADSSSPVEFFNSRDKKASQQGGGGTSSLPRAKARKLADVTVSDL